MYEILEKTELAPNIKQYIVFAPLIARSAKAGQFVIIRVDRNGERIPLTISDFDRDKGTISMISQEVGYSTKLLGEKRVGEALADVAGPLGQPTEYGLGVKAVLCVGGGVGTSVLIPQVKMLSAKGVHVDVIIGGRSKEFVILEDAFSGADHIYPSTDDGSYGYKGRVTELMEDLVLKGKKYDVVMAVGPLIMMKMVSLLTKKYNIETIVSLNPIMIDGTGMCGCCRVTVDGETKYACVDGPDFDGHLVDFDEVMMRQSTYKQEEKAACERGACLYAR